MLAIAKFGGSSLSCAANWKRVREIVTGISPGASSSSPLRESAMPMTIKLRIYSISATPTCATACRAGSSGAKSRACYLAIRDECAIDYPIEDDLDAIYESLSAGRARMNLPRGENTWLRS